LGPTMEEEEEQAGFGRLVLEEYLKCEESFRADRISKRTWDNLSANHKKEPRQKKTGGKMGGDVKKADGPLPEGEEKRIGKPGVMRKRGSCERLKKKKKQGKSPQNADEQKW